MPCLRKVASCLDAAFRAPDDAFILLSNASGNDMRRETVLHVPVEPDHRSPAAHVSDADAQHCCQVVAACNCTSHEALTMMYCFGYLSD